MNDKITQSDTLELKQIFIGIRFIKTHCRYSWRENKPLSPFVPGERALISMTEKTERATLDYVRQLFMDGYILLLNTRETEKMVREANEDLVRRLKGEE